MGVGILRWRPKEVCSCVVVITFDPSEPAETRAHNLVRVERACPDHQVGTESTLFNTLLEESPRQNYATQEVLSNAPAAMFETDAETGQRIFRRGITLDYSWSGIAPNRLLTFTVRGTTLTNQQLNAIQNRLNTRFGSGKVSVVQG